MNASNMTLPTRLPATELGSRAVSSCVTRIATSNTQCFFHPHEQLSAYCSILIQMTGVLLNPGSREPPVFLSEKTADLHAEEDCQQEGEAQHSGQYHGQHNCSRHCLVRLFRLLRKLGRPVRMHTRYLRKGYYTVSQISLAAVKIAWHLECLKRNLHMAHSLITEVLHECV